MEEPRKYFVQIEANNKRATRDLGQMNLDIFESSVAQLSQGVERKSDEKVFVVSGLLDIEEVEKLVLMGYRVTIEEEASKRARATDTVIDFERWLKEMGE